MADGPPDRDDGWNEDPPEAGRRDESGSHPPDDAGPGDERASDVESDPSLASILGAEQEESDARELVPGSPTLENAAFVALGVLFTILVLYRAWTVFVG